MTRGRYVPSGPLPCRCRCGAARRRAAPRRACRHAVFIIGAACAPPPVPLVTLVGAWRAFGREGNVTNVMLASVRCAGERDGRHPRAVRCREGNGARIAGGTESSRQDAACVGVVGRRYRSGGEDSPSQTARYLRGREILAPRDVCGFCGFRRRLLGERTAHWPALDICPGFVSGHEPRRQRNKRNLRPPWASLRHPYIGLCKPCTDGRAQRGSCS